MYKLKKLITFSLEAESNKASHTSKCEPLLSPDLWCDMIDGAFYRQHHQNFLTKLEKTALNLLSLWQNTTLCFRLNLSLICVFFVSQWVKTKIYDNFMDLSDDKQL